MRQLHWTNFGYADRLIHSPDDAFANAESQLGTLPYLSPPPIQLQFILQGLVHVSTWPGNLSCPYSMASHLLFPVTLKVGIIFIEF